MERPQHTPALGGGADLSLDDLLTHLRLWRSDTLATIDRLRAHRRQAEASERQLESPRAIKEYIDFFIDMLTRAAADFDRVLEELPEGLKQAHLDTLRQLASNAAAEQRRCLLFRDKWINRPLPYEQVRPLLTQISADTRDQLVDFRELTAAAARLVVLAGPILEEGSKGMGRRELFNRLLRRDEEGNP